jgi:hypothetical protein
MSTPAMTTLALQCILISRRPWPVARRLLVSKPHLQIDPHVDRLALPRAGLEPPQPRGVHGSLVETELGPAFQPAWNGDRSSGTAITTPVVRLPTRTKVAARVQTRRDRLMVDSWAR